MLLGGAGIPHFASTITALIPGEVGTCGLKRGAVIETQGHSLSRKEKADTADYGVCP